MDASSTNGRRRGGGHSTTYRRFQRARFSSTPSPSNISIGRVLPSNLAKAFPAFVEGQMLQQWAGLIHVTPDAISVIGPVGSHTRPLSRQRVFRPRLRHRTPCRQVDGRTCYWRSPLVLPRAVQVRTVSPTRVSMARGLRRPLGAKAADLTVKFDPYASIGTWSYAPWSGGRYHPSRSPMPCWRASNSFTRYFTCSARCMPGARALPRLLPMHVERQVGRDRPWHSARRSKISSTLPDVPPMRGPGLSMIGDPRPWSAAVVRLEAAGDGGAWPHAHG